MENSNEKIDILKRDEFINRVIQFVDNISEKKGNATFAINGEWGCGKTFVLEKIQEQLEHDKKFLVIPYNCWQYDYYNEPLLAIVSALIDFDESRKMIDRETLIALGNIILILSEVAVVTTADAETGSMFIQAAAWIKNIFKKIRKSSERSHKYDPYYTFKKALLELKEQLKKLSEQYTIVLAVDELDRCLPEYAIKVLERLHHVSEGLSNMVTIIAVDKKRLENTVESIFGDKEQCAEKYLKKFIQFEIQLDNGEPDIIQFLKKFSDFSSRFNESLYKINGKESFLKELFLGVNIRSLEKIVKNATIVHDISFGKEEQDYTIMCMELFYSALHCYYETKSIFYDNHKIDRRDKSIFGAYKDFPEKFNSENSAFQCIKRLVGGSAMYPGRLHIDSKNIFNVVSYYWYNLPSQISCEQLQNHELYPYINQQDKNKISLDNNIEKLKRFLYSLKIVK